MDSTVEVNKKILDIFKSNHPILYKIALIDATQPIKEIYGKDEITLDSIIEIINIFFKRYNEIIDATSLNRTDFIYECGKTTDFYTTSINLGSHDDKEWIPFILRSNWTIGKYDIYMGSESIDSSIYAIIIININK
jgi:hypothetical protein